MISGDPGGSVLRRCLDCWSAVPIAQLVEQRTFNP